MRRKAILSALAVVVTLGAAWAAGPRQAILDSYAAAAGGAKFSAEAGKSLFQDAHTGGNADTPSCSTCHTKDPRNAGRTRVGKDIAPMAVSKTPDRFTDPAKVEKWFTRNCNTVLGRECTPQEKGDFITYMSSL